MQAISAHDANGAQSDQLVAGEPLPIVVGDVVGAKYTVDAIIGIGGMGVVAAATHTALGQRVAMKVMRTARMSPETADRFLSEARAAVSLKSSHVARVLDVGTLESGLPFMVMELLEGEDLAAKLDKRGALPCAEAIDYVLQACDAIAEAHALGIVHRDLKPENLFVTERRDGTALVKVLDFGISKVTSTVEATEGPTSRRAITHESTVMGSPMYMSPEQIRSAKHVDGRSDIWSLGAILYELVAGEGAFWAESVPDIFVKVLDKPAPRLEDAVRDAPPGLAQVIARCLEKDRNKRYETVDALAIDLANLGAKATSPTIPPWDRSVEIPFGEPADAATRDAFALSPLASAADSGPSVLRRTGAETFVLSDRPRPRRKWLVGFVALVAIAGSGLGGARWYQHRLAAARAAGVAAAAAPEAAPAPTSATAVADGTAGTTDPPSSGGVPSSATPSALSRAGAAPIADGSRRAPAPAARPRAVAASAGKAVATNDPQPAVAPKPAVAAPQTAPAPTLRRTDW